MTVDNVPRIIWTYWNGGETELPPLQRACIGIMRRLHPGWRVVVLDNRTGRGCVPSKT